MAHRGDCSAAPENTLASVQAALLSGCQAVEIDVQLAADRVPVLFHDRDFQRLLTPVRAGCIADYPLAQLQQWLISEPQRLANVSAALTPLSVVVDCLRRQPAVTLFVEVKRAALERFSDAEVYAAVSEVLQPIRGQVVLISFALPFLVYARGHGDWPLGVVLESWAWLDDGRLDARVTALAAEYLFCNIDRLPAHARLSSTAARWVIYEVASVAVMQALAKRGVTMVESFFPQQLQADVDD